MPFMKTSNVMATARATKEKPDLEEAIDESDDGEDPAVERVAPDDDGDISKDKFIKQPKKKAAPKSKAASKKTPKEESEGESDAAVKPKKGGRGKAVKGNKKR